MSINNINAVSFGLRRKSSPIQFVQDNISPFALINYTGAPTLLDGKYRSRNHRTRYDVSVLKAPDAPMADPSYVGLYIAYTNGSPDKSGIVFADAFIPEDGTPTVSIKRNQTGGVLRVPQKVRSLVHKAVGNLFKRTDLKAVLAERKQSLNQSASV